MLPNMAHSPDLHLVSFQVPFPPDYGGIIDVYYKLKALKRAGLRVALHTFAYSRDADLENLLQVAEEVHIYPRHRGFISQLSPTPYIVQSRSDSSLLDNLLRDSAPVLFEGLHTTFALPGLAKHGRLLMVRTHNVEHDYYRGLARSSHSLKHSLFYNIEALKLRRYENVLAQASAIFAISPADTAYFSRRFGGEKVVCLPPFFDESPIIDPLAPVPQVLYHGNLEVEENIDAVCRIAEDILPLLPSGVKFVVAGRNPSPKLVGILAAKGIEVMANPDEALLNGLIAGAAVNLLITRQPTGIKLKLMNVLSLARGACVVNDMMVAGSALSRFCRVASAPEAIAEAVTESLAAPEPSDVVDRRRADFLNEYSSSRGAGIILRKLECRN